MGSSRKSSANPDYRLIIILLVLAGLSLFFILLGRNYLPAAKTDTSKKASGEVQKEEEEDVSHFFEKETGAEIDPFREGCNTQSPGGKIPSVFSNTVCLK